VEATTLPLPRLKEPPFDVYDLHSCTWSRQPTRGEAPLLGLGSSLNVHHETRTLYLFGGWNATAFDSDVYRIRLEEWRWEKVELKSDVKPSRRYLTCVLIYKSRMCTRVGRSWTGHHRQGPRSDVPMDPSPLKCELQYMCMYTCTSKHCMLYTYTCRQTGRQAGKQAGRQASRQVGR